MLLNNSTLLKLKEQIKDLYKNKDFDIRQQGPEKSEEDERAETWRLTFRSWPDKSIQ